MNNQIPPQLPFRTEVLENAEIIAAARTIINEGPICDNCLGRQFAKIASGLTNEKRGEILRSVLRAELKEGKCWLCNGLFENFDALVVKALETLKGYEFDSFLVGTKVSGMLLENEELLWEIAGAAYAEPLKSELNREVGKRIEHETGKIADFDRPDLVVILNLVTEEVELQINSVFIYGRYRKFKRGIPQTKWLCRVCRGKGCERCDFTGKMYAESVEELIGGSILEEFGGVVTVLHGSGREDIDARMLGSGRPFVMEIKEPKLRELDLKRLENKVNEENKDKVEVLNFQYVKREAVAKIKNAKVDKTYRAIVSLKTDVLEEDLRSALDNLIGAVIEQRTPLRVVHRRADLVRKRKVYDARLVSFEVPIVELKCDGGLYIKELISGDNGRTIPSLSELLGTEAEVMELDVVDVAI
uniref:tRNA pseudouridine synthase Pus10 n=1 Tax=Candidatus Methanophaga sp. ANME-1 ERB7 TaxID=2759913 RepID=A0A7G9ZBP7_9EURY|nr:tRNA pseudouridine synthase Pus10 [Methanosarcinales archaeon ANME-1 ERB7]